MELVDESIFLLLCLFIALQKQVLTSVAREAREVDLLFVITNFSILCPDQVERRKATSSLCNYERSVISKYFIYLL